jgi:hypothetical protein
MVEPDAARWRELGEATAELADALQVVLLYAAGLDRALCDTHWRNEATSLRQAAERAADALARVRGALAQVHPLSPS